MNYSGTIDRDAHRTRCRCQLRPTQRSQSHDSRRHQRRSAHFEPSSLRCCWWTSLPPRSCIGFVCGPRACRGRATCDHIPLRGLLRVPGAAASSSRNSIQAEIQEEASFRHPIRRLPSSCFNKCRFSLALTDDERAELARGAKRSLFAAARRLSGKAKPEARRSSCHAELRPSQWSLKPEVARIERGGFFGEMPLPYRGSRGLRATVRTAVDSELLEITVEENFPPRLQAANPSAVDQIGEAVAARRAELSQHAAASAAGCGSRAARKVSPATRPPVSSALGSA